MDVGVVLPALAGLALLFVLIPVALTVLFHYRRPRLLRCPVTERDVAVQINAGLAALGSLAGGRALALRDCSLWRVDSPCCCQECLANVDEAEVVDKRVSN